MLRVDSKAVSCAALVVALSSVLFVCIYAYDVFVMNRYEFKIYSHVKQGHGYIRSRSPVATMKDKINNKVYVLKVHGSGIDDPLRCAYNVQCSWVLLADTKGKKLKE